VEPILWFIATGGFTYLGALYTLEVIFGPLP
jgi:hypothetical protein